MRPDLAWPTGSEVLDAMMGGGFPRQRVIAITGGAGSGKTVLAAQVAAAQARHGVSSVFVAFEQSSERVRADLAGFMWAECLGDARVEIIEAGVPRQAVINGDFDLEALITILDTTVQRIDAEIVILDGIDALLSMLGDEDSERRELFRIGTWLRDNGLTGIVTAKATATWTRSLERAAIIDYQSDGVIALDFAQSGTVVSRTLRVSKLRGTDHRGDVTPFVIDSSGIRVAYLPTARRTASTRTSERLSSGVPTLDEMLQGGYLRGSATLISGPPGTAKTSLAAAFVHAATAQEKALYVTFDESETELVFHMASIGYDMSDAVASAALQVLALRSAHGGPERHLVDILAAVDRLGAAVVVIDPVSAFNAADHPLADMMTHHLFHELDRRGVTVVCTSLISDGAGSDESTKSQISTIADNWLHVTYLAHGGERNRALTVVKARGTANSNQVRELVISPAGVALLPVYLSGGDVLVGAARAEREELEKRIEWERAAAYEQQRTAAQNDIDNLASELGRVERELTARRAALAAIEALRLQEIARGESELESRERMRSVNLTEAL